MAGIQAAMATPSAPEPAAPAAPPEPGVPAEGVASPEAEATGEPAAPASEATPGQPAGEPPAATPEDPEFDIPGEGRMKLSEYRALKAGHLKDQDYTHKTQQLADQRKEMESQLQQHQRWLMQALTDPKAADGLRVALGFQAQAPAGPDPVTAPEEWMDAKYTEMVRGGAKGEEITRGYMENQLIQAQNKSLHTKLQSFEQQQTQARQSFDNERHALAMERSIVNELARPGNELINNDRGRDLVDRFISAAVQRGQQVDVGQITAEVKSLAAGWVGQYVNKKTEQARATAPVGKGGGATAAPQKWEPSGKRSEFYDVLSPGFDGTKT